MFDKSFAWVQLDELSLQGFIFAQDHTLSFFRRYKNTLQLHRLENIRLDGNPFSEAWIDFSRYVQQERAIQLESLELVDTIYVTQCGIKGRVIKHDKIVHPQRAVCYLMCKAKINMSGKNDAVAQHGHDWDSISQDIILESLFLWVSRELS